MECGASPVLSLDVAGKYLYTYFVQIEFESCKMKEVSVTELRQNLQAYLAKARSGQRVRITAHGRVIAEIAPPTPNVEAASGARRRLRGSVRSFRKPTAPAFDAAEWDMNR